MSMRRSATDKHPLFEGSGAKNEDMNRGRPAAEDMIPANDPFPLPSSYQTIIVTPEMASSWLSHRRHPTLRPLSPKVAAGYQEQMERGEWREDTPEGYFFDTEGYIISGQHRLKAQANAGATLKMRIFPGESRDMAPYLDAGFKRRAAHLMRMPNAADIASGARILAALEAGEFRSLTRLNRITTPQVLAVTQAWPELQYYVAKVRAVWRYGKVPISLHLALLAQAERTEARELIPDWLEGLSTGADLGALDPRLKLRSRFAPGLPEQRGRGKRDLAYGLIVKAWNAYVAGEDVQVLRFSLAEDLPIVTGFDPRKGGNPV